MNLNALPPLMEGERRPSQPGFRVARLALLFLLLVNVGGALWNSVVVLPRVRPDRFAEYVRLLVVYPSALALLTGISIWWIRRERVAGAVLGAGLLAFQGIRILLDALEGDGDYPSPSTRVVGQLTMGGFASVFLAASVALLFTARTFRRHRNTGGS
jgi:hypothetical protein